MAFNVHQQSHYNSLPSQKPHIARCSKCIQDMQSARAIPGHCELQETGCMIFSNVPPQQSRKKYSAKFQPGYILFGSFLLYFRRVPPLGFFHYFSFPSGMGRLVNIFFKEGIPFSIQSRRSASGTVHVVSSSKGCPKHPPKPSTAKKSSRHIASCKQMIGSHNTFKLLSQTFGSKSCHFKHIQTISKIFQNCATGGFSIKWSLLIDLDIF